MVSAHMKPVSVSRILASFRKQIAAVAAIGWLATAACWPAAKLEAALRAGAATVNITPPLGIEMNGNMSAQPVLDIHDELWVRAIVLDDGTNRLAFAVLDNCVLDRAVIDAAKALIFQHTGIATNHVCVSATHTHSAGSVAGVHLTDADDEYRRSLPRKVSDAVRLAARHLASARIAWGSGALPQYAFCRRVRVKPDVVYTNLLGLAGDRAKMNWTSPEPDIDFEAAGPVDPQLSVLSIQHADGRPLAVLANYSQHYAGGTRWGDVSADYFGTFGAILTRFVGAERQDPPFVAVMSNGTSADTNPFDFRRPKPALPPYALIEEMGRAAASEVHRVLGTLTYRDDVTLGSAAEELALAVRKPSAEQIERSRMVVNGRDRHQLRTWPEIFAREQLIVAEYPDVIRAPLQVFRIGDLAVAQWPGEIFAVTGLDLKERSPIQPLFNISLANGWYGYLPPPEQHALGAYETWLMRTSLLETNAIPRITGVFLDLLGRLAVGR
jgi:neutral ceramidase